MRVPTLSIVVPAFRESLNLGELHRRLQAALAGESFELILVDDGSPDDTWRAIRDLNAVDPRVRGVRLSRNFGHQSAVWAGLSMARGEVVVTMDADLQHPPELIPSMLRRWRSGSQIVHTIRKDSEATPAWKRHTSRTFARIFSVLAGVQLPDGVSDFRLLDRRVANDLLSMPERNLFLRGAVHWVGYDAGYETFECGERFEGSTSFTLRRLASLSWKAVTAFSIVPLRLAVGLGLLVSLLATYQLFEALYVGLFTDRPVPGWASMIGLMSLLFVALFVVLGVLGEYLARILEEVRRRPRYIVSDSVETGEVQPGTGEP